jgi:hypothetical protein
MRVLTVLALLTGVAALVLVVFDIEVSEDEEFEGVTLSLQEEEDTAKSNDVPPRQRGDDPPGVGDSIVGTSDISGDREGRLVGSCLIISSELEGSCQATYTFDDGSIEVAASRLGGLVELAVPDFEAETYEVAVIGGTGAYEGATGAGTWPGDTETAPMELRLLLPEGEDD